MTCIKYNNIIDVQYESRDAILPATLDEFKRHLNLQFDTEGGYEFNDDDTYLQAVLEAATVAIEKFTGVLLRDSDVTAVIRNEKGGQSLPYGPVTEFTDLVDSDDVSITDYKLRGLSFKSLVSPCKSEMTATYRAGYTAATVPASLKMAVLHQGAFLYESRGDQQQQYASAEVAMSTSAKALANPYRRVVWLL